MRSRKKKYSTTVHPWRIGLRLFGTASLTIQLANCVSQLTTSVEPIERGYTYLVRPVDIASLSTEERLRLLEDLWESLRAAPERIPLTDAQREELNPRLDDLDLEGPTGIPWEEVFSNIRNRGL